MPRKINTENFLQTKPLTPGQPIHVLLPYLLLGIGLIFLGLGLVWLDDYRRHSGRKQTWQALRTALARADAQPDPESGLILLQRLPPPAGDQLAVRFRILNRRWEIARNRLAELQRARANPLLRGKLEGELEAFQSFLDALEAGASAELDGRESPAPQPWHLLNLRAGVRAMHALVILEWEGNRKKATPLLEAGIADLKSAIRAVDKATLDPSDRKIPRWNLELLQARGDSQRIGLGRGNGDPKTDLGKNLEALLPESGGYAPGAPVERRMQK